MGVSRIGWQDGVERDAVVNPGPFAGQCGLILVGYIGKQDGLTMSMILNGVCAMQSGRHVRLGGGGYIEIPRVCHMGGPPCPTPTFHILL